MYAVRLSNGQETYGRDRAHAERLFQACAAEGRCWLVYIHKCSRRVLAVALKQQDAPTLGHYVRAAQGTEGR